LFLIYYEKFSERRFVYDPYWDIISLFNVLADPLTVYLGWSAFGIYIDSKLMER